MNIYWDRILLTKVPNRRRWKHDWRGQTWEFFPRLVGINVSNVGTHFVANCQLCSEPWKCGEVASLSEPPIVEPAYIPLIRIQRRAGQVFIEVNDDKPRYLITLQARRPFVNVFHYDWDYLGEVYEDRDV